MTLLIRSLRHFGLLAVVAGVFAVAALLLMSSGNAARSAEAAIDNVSVISVTDSSPPTQVVAERDTAGTTAIRMSTLEGVVRSLERPRDGPADRDISSIWILPIALVGVGILAHQLLLGSGNSYPSRSSRADAKKGNPRRSSAGMRPWFVAGP